MNQQPQQLAEHFFRHEASKIEAVLIKTFGLREIELAEDIVQDTMVEAMESWSLGQIPHNPAGWLMDVAKKKTINYLKRYSLYQNKILPRLEKPEPGIALDFSDEQIKDSQLRMIFSCCHPSLQTEAQLALALKSLCGLSVKEIAHALLTQENTIEKRLYRARQKFRKREITLELPSGTDFNQRLDNVLLVHYLLFNEGYYSNHPEKTIREELCFEAIRLQELLLQAFPDSDKAKALLALMYLNFARFESRRNPAGELVLLENQDRDNWDRNLIAKGILLLNEAREQNQLSPYHLKAGIAAEHCLAHKLEDTNWANIYHWYQLLQKTEDSEIIRLNKAIALFFTGNGKKDSALTDLSALEGKGDAQFQLLLKVTQGALWLKKGKEKKGKTLLTLALKQQPSPQLEKIIHQYLKGL